MPVSNDFTAILSGQSWAGPAYRTNSPVFVTYSFEAAVQAYLTISNFTQGFLDSFAAFSEVEKTAARAALAQWADASGIVFLEVAAGEGDIRFGSYDFTLDPGTSGFDGVGYNPATDVTQYYAYRDLLGGDVFFNHGTASDPYLLLHEIGHALGFKHPFEGDPTLDPSFDNHTYTIMSYTGTTPGTLGIFDLQAIEHVYGNSASDGTQVASWSWDSVNRVLTQTGFAGDDRILGVSVRDVINGAAGIDWIGGFQGNDQLTGGSGHDSLFGNEGNDTLNGGSENDWLDGGTGTDTMVGGAGDDIFILDSASDVTSELAGGGDDSIYSTITISLRTNIERLYLLDAANINGTGNTLDNVIGGNSGNNILNGGAGADYLFGLGGNDTYLVDNIFDTVAENAGEGIDIVRASFDWALGADVEKLYILGTATDGSGNALSNYIYGNSLANFIDGGGGADRLYGYGGNDTYVVDSSGDLVFESAAAGTDTVLASVNHTLAANVENLAISAAGSANATGNMLANVIDGGAGVNFIDGKLGNDTLTGNGGIDHFVFTTALGAGNIDTITDFSVISDFIRLENAIFTGLANGYLAVAAFRIGAAAADADDRIVYDNMTGALFFDSDGSGAAAAQQFAVVSAGLAMTNADIFVI
jgi:Ca2+-binding RTX toxin-like protein